MRSWLLSAVISLWVGSLIGAALGSDQPLWWIAWVVAGGAIVMALIRARKERNVT